VSLRRVENENRSLVRIDSETGVSVSNDEAAILPRKVTQKFTDGVIGLPAGGQPQKPSDARNPISDQCNSTRVPAMRPANKESGRLDAKEKLTELFGTWALAAAVSISRTAGAF